MKCQGACISSYSSYRVPMHGYIVASRVLSTPLKPNTLNDRPGWISWLSTGGAFGYRFLIRPCLFSFVALHGFPRLMKSGIRIDAPHGRLHRFSLSWDMCLCNIVLLCSTSALLGRTLLRVYLLAHVERVSADLRNALKLATCVIDVPPPSRLYSFSVVLVQAEKLPVALSLCSSSCLLRTR